MQIGGNVTRPQKEDKQVLRLRHRDIAMEKGITK